MARVRWPLICALAALLAFAPAASAAWGPVQDIAALDSGSGFAYDGNGRGDRILVWQAPGGGFRFAQAAPGRPFGPAREVPKRDAKSEYAPRVELDERGNALLVVSYFDETDTEEIDIRDETCCVGLRGYVIRRAGSITSAKTLAPPGNSIALQDMQIGPGGRFGVVFEYYPQHSSTNVFEARFGTVAKGFGARERLPDASGYASRYALSFPGRRARLLRFRLATRNGGIFDEVERVRAGRYRRVGAVASRKATPNEVRIATAPSGEQAASWTEYDGRTRALVAVRRPGGAFRVRSLAREQYQSPPDAPAIEPGGNAVVTIWIPERGIFGAVRRPRQGFGKPTTLVRPFEGYVSGFDADVNRRGLVLLVWIEQPQGEPPRLRGAFRNSRGSVIEDHTIVGGDNQFGFGHALSLDREGRGSVAYIYGGRLRVISARVGG